MSVNYFIKTPSGTLYIDALLDDAKWDSPVGQAATVSYSFSLSGSLYPSSLPEAASFQAVNASVQSAARTAFEQWAAVANITFEEKTSQEEGDIRIAQSPYLIQEGAAGWAYTLSNGTYFPGADTLIPNEIAGDIWFMPFSSEVVEGDNDYQTIIHEIGHALGLEHPFEGEYTLNSNVDSVQYTVMSYTSHPEEVFAQLGSQVERLQPSTPMLYDIAAIQYLYGANTSYNYEDTTYTFDDTPKIMTLWDGGGTDTLNFSPMSSSVSVSLEEGSYSSFGRALDQSYQEKALKNNFAIAFNAEIENLHGSAYDDTLRGNALNNEFKGGGGTDRINGVRGEDVVIIDNNFSQITITEQGSTNVVTTPDSTLLLQNIDALKIDGGYVDLHNLKSSQIRVATTDNIMEIARLYKAALDRTPDNDGLNYWIDEYERGFTLQNISQSFVDAEEFNSLFNVSNDDSFITTLYANVLDREPDQEGFDYWLNDIANGRTYSDILVSFSESAENIQNTSNLDDGLDYQIESGLWVI